MPRIEVITVWVFVPFHVAFTMNDYGEIGDIATGITRNHARVRSLRKHEKRYP
jgi:hypothetical protein